MARAVKRYGLDEYIARTILIRIGSNPPIVLLGMMVTTAVLSMWISNTATTALMITVAVPIVRSFPKDEPFRKAIILGIPFASNIGGIGTPYRYTTQRHRNGDSGKPRSRDFIPSVDAHGVTRGNCSSCALLAYSLYAVSRTHL